MLGIKQIKVDGTEVSLNGKRLTLQEAQELVATGTKRSLIELLPMRGNPNRPGSQVMYVHEEGLLHNLPVNKLASSIMGHTLVGDVIIVKHEAIDFMDEDAA